MISLRSTRSFLFCTALLLCASWALSDSLQLRDGRHFDGKYVGGTESAVAFFTQGSVDYFPVHEVLLVVFGEGNNPSLGPPGTSPMSQPAPVVPKSHLKSTKGDQKTMAPSQGLGKTI